MSVKKVLVLVCLIVLIIFLFFNNAKNKDKSNAKDRGIELSFLLDRLSSLEYIKISKLGDSVYIYNDNGIYRTDRYIVDKKSIDNLKYFFSLKSNELASNNENNFEKMGVGKSGTKAEFFVDGTTYSYILSSKGGKTYIRKSDDSYIYVVYDSLEKYLKTDDDYWASRSIIDMSNKNSFDIKIQRNGNIVNISKDKDKYKIFFNGDLKSERAVLGILNSLIKAISPLRSFGLYDGDLIEEDEKQIGIMDIYANSDKYRLTFLEAGDKVLVKKNGFDIIYIVPKYKYEALFEIFNKL